MKTVQDKDGNEVQVPNNTMCKAGRNGGLPQLYTTEELAVIEAELAAREEAWNAESVSRNAKAKIMQLEAEITNRRLREAILGTDNGWLVKQESLIAIERAKLGG
jgi:hypothetical protein